MLTLKLQNSEHFVTYVEATALDANSLSAFILDALRENELDPQCIVSQGYDGASVMSGRCAGVQQKICEVIPHATYVHCYAHCLNFVRVDSTTKCVSEASDFFSHGNPLYFFVTERSLPMLFSSRSSLNYSQASRKDNCRDFHIHVSLVGT